MTIFSKLREIWLVKFPFSDLTLAVVEIIDN